MDSAVLNSEFIATKVGDITVYNYDGETREYISISTEYLAVGVGIPACSCLDAPGAYKAGYAICRSADFNSWEYVPDHRGEIVFSTETGESKEITAPGDYPDNTTTNAAGLLTAPLSSLRRTASLTGNVLKTVAGAPVALLRSGLSALRAVAVMFMNPLAVLRGGLAAAGAVLRVLASGPLAMLRVALYAISGLLGALLSPIGLVVTALAGVALVVWKYWQPITAFLGGVVEGFKAAAGPISAAFEPLKPVFQWIGDKVQALWGWFTDLLTPVKSTSAELQSAAAMGRRFGEALAEGLNMVMHPLDSLKSGVSWLLEKLGIVSKEAAKAKLPESVTRQQPATVNADGKVMMPSGGFPSWGYGFAGMYDSGGYIPRGQFGIVGENGPEIVNGPANVTSRRNTAALAAVVAGMMGVAAAPAELPQLHPLALPAKGGEAIVSRAATVPLVQRIEAPTQIIIQTQPGQSAQDIAREVARQLDERERRLKAKARSNYSDQGGYDA
ncbi:phage tail protein [Escherichia coli]|nr:phage tail protein [Escherichia coli]